MFCIYARVVILYMYSLLRYCWVFLLALGVRFVEVCEFVGLNVGCGWVCDALICGIFFVTSVVVGGRYYVCWCCCGC